MAGHVLGATGSSADGGQAFRTSPAIHMTPPEQGSIVMVGFAGPFGQAAGPSYFPAH